MKLSTSGKVLIVKQFLLVQCKYQRKYLENSVENMHADIRDLRVKVWIIKKNYYELILAFLCS